MDLALQYASNELKADKEVALAAVKNTGYALEFASDELKADKEVVTTAVNNAGDALAYASHKFKADKEVVMLAVNVDMHLHTLTMHSKPIKRWYWLQ